MNFVEALQRASLPENHYMWLRPVTWRDRSEAYVLHNGRVLLVPSFSGGAAWLTTKLAELTGEWELVSPDDVLNTK